MSGKVYIGHSAFRIHPPFTSYFPQEIIVMFIAMASVLQAVPAFVCVFIIRFIYRQVVVRYTLRHVPGPKASSIIWGEELKLYHNAPGSVYADMHRKFGKVIKFTGAFGVSIDHTAAFTTTDLDTLKAPDVVHNRRSGYCVHSRGGNLPVSQTVRCSSLVQSSARRRNSMG